MTKYIFVTGGVVSSLGKGITLGSIGRILKSRGVKVSLQKLDPYLNVDPGTMSPYQHGEVYVTADGCETDLDLGHYERFVDTELTRFSNVTAGQIYSSIIGRERHGDFLGGTIQTIPHVTNAIKERILALARETEAEVVVVEVGGTVGDIEGQPFLEAIRQMRNQVGRDNVYYIHLTLLPYISSTGELKTKPTQHSVRELRTVGIQPDCIVLRSDHPVEESVRAKVSAFCDVPVEAVIPLMTVSSVYEVPLILEEAGLGRLLTRALGLLATTPDLGEWRDLVERTKAPKQPLSIAIVGKYSDLPDSYLSVREALHHAGLAHGRDVQVTWVRAEAVEQEGAEKHLRMASGIVVPGGFGPRGVEGMIQAARYAREQKVPYLGLCLGLQLMVIELARNAAGLHGANSTEFDPDTKHPVVAMMPDQRRLETMGGTMRLGNYPCCLQEGTKVREAYGVPMVQERHRHRFEINNAYRDRLGEVGLVCSGRSPDDQLVEIGELLGHPFMLGTQFHPEFRSRPNRPHPLFSSFIAAAQTIVREGGQHRLPLDGAELGEAQREPVARAP
ncbi:MAG: CTP synthase [Dehalococcoidia bacterium]|nr:CTP synthase [Dehalococcoidia bacterium]